MFIAAVFINAKTWTYPRYPTVGEWINKLWYIQTMECCSSLKRDELSNYEKTWKKHECILLSERSQSENVTEFMTPRIWYGKKAMKIAKRLVVASS